MQWHNQFFNWSFYLQNIKIIAHMVEFEVVKFLVYLELDVGNLREEALGEYKRPPLPFISHIHTFLTFAYAATLPKLCWYLSKIFSYCYLLRFFTLRPQNSCVLSLSNKGSWIPLFTLHINDDFLKNSCKILSCFVEFRNIWN